MKSPELRAAVRGAGALLAVTSAVLHSFSLSALTLVMAAVCLYCGYELWRFDTVRSWLLVAVMNIAMIGAHLPLAAGHDHSGGPVSATAGMGTAMQLATVVALAEIVLAAAVLFARTRAPE